MNLITTRRVLAGAFLLGSVSLAFAGGWGNGPSFGQAGKIIGQAGTDIKNGVNAVGKPLEEARKQVQDPGGYKKKLDEAQQGAHQEIATTKTWVDDTKTWVENIRGQITKDLYIIVGMICSTICFVAVMFRPRRPAAGSPTTTAIAPSSRTLAGSLES